jgi:hypothetical protein
VRLLIVMMAFPPSERIFRPHPLEPRTCAVTATP